MNDVERETKTAAFRIVCCSSGKPETAVLERPNKVVKPWRNILRKEVIQPQVPLRLPCYDFTPVA